MLAGIPFCQFHVDFRAREVEFILRFTEASALILPRQFRRFDYLDMLLRLRRAFHVCGMCWVSAKT